ncbi:aspartate aminotransferase family protein [Oharaeibacter diazotrophicus]|uniref:Acetylornithine aminotransferase n=1 Tax=Oharaeibacter diazotrophicus TaxID=1920512 RepID=A0A4R6R6A7_9HYPH|nr:aspartate aminotransferase family protein [Oharaeibacter diazotrophicus]TDP81481.1 acetylornithine aminotransferase [Oharaeibacter diazotrophicus]BBE73719.1 succinylornithine transaminase/acetylornithine aminotransferase [Pleomorphomonas sp. SM30]GLS75508.1 acetylornithine aminotransferase [Oharaeibacter diazotrophicus]
MTAASPADPLFATFARADVAFERGEGAWLVASDGSRWLDFGSGIAVNALGHAHPHLVAALTDQASRLWHVSNAFRIPEQERLAARLVAATFADRVFFTNSGAEALECAIKTARRYHWAKGRPERIRIVTFEGAFHGRTLATLAAGGQQKYLDGFGPKVEGFDQVPFFDLEALKAAITPETAAVLVEPIQGEGGIRPIPAQDLRALREICDANDILLIFDEVQTGIGRTGKLFAHEWTGVTPDILASAKGLGGGFPVGACLATEAAAAAMTAGSHGTTFGGNPLAMAVGNAVLDVVLAPGFLEHVQTLGLRLKQGLAQVVDQHPTVFEGVRGEGLMLGLKCKLAPAEVAAAFRGEKLLTIAAGDNVVRLLPPLIVDEAEVREAIARIDAAAAAIEAKAA